MIVAEAQEEVIVCKDYMQIMKGKRTKRQRPLSPLTLAMVSTSSSTAESGGEGERFSVNSGVIGGLDRPLTDFASPTTSIEEFTTSTEEEEDMANCLILLAQGHTKKLSADDQPAAISNTATITTTRKAGGLYVYQCKTCNRCFPSFQALGGHRASHKKPKANNININEEKKALVINMEEDDDHLGNMSTTLSLQIANGVANLCANNNVVKANKVHECSICGAEFSSGQALGGHMRRHRAFMSTANTTTTTTALSIDHRSPEAKKRPRNILQLDLNLPAPEDHDHHLRRESKFSFASKEQVIVFSASSLVDCHY